jgi:hypothetical protein
MLITTVTVSALIFANFLLVSHPGARMLVTVLLMAGGVFALARTAMNRVDAAGDRARRRGRRGLAGLLLTLFTGACRMAPTQAPEPAEIATLDCGGRTCSIGQAGPSTIVWVSE